MLKLLKKLEMTINGSTELVERIDKGVLYAYKKFLERKEKNKEKIAISKDGVTKIVDANDINVSFEKGI